jgi:hypothetical protein
LDILCEGEGEDCQLGMEASELRQEGKKEQAKEKYLESFKQLQDTWPDLAALMLFDAGDCALFEEPMLHFHTVAGIRKEDAHAWST